MTGTLGPARWRILWPKPAIPGGNDASVVVEIEGGGVPASVYLGDLSQEGSGRCPRARSSWTATTS